MSSLSPVARPKRRVRVHFSNRTKVLLCYLLSFALPPLWLFLGITLVYPYQLTGSAPTIARNMGDAFPFLKSSLLTAARLAAAPEAGSPAEWAAALEARDGQWIVFLAAALGLAWAVTLLLQLVWRFSHSRALDAAKNTRLAIAHYRWTLLLIVLCNLAVAAALWLLGVRFVEGRGLWDYLVYFGAYPINVLAAILCFRLAAPPVLSGRHGFFKRL
ncbi:MAG: hypothetical protein PHI98_00465 [Eubacteriales bacterium]|nr:hypothetical protein [Eubacteriales bacterium]